MDFFPLSRGVASDMWADKHTNSIFKKYPHDDITKKRMEDVFA